MSLSAHTWPAALALLAASCSPQQVSTRTNLLVVTLDTTRVDAIGCYSGPPGVSPTIDAFAAHGVRFANAYSSVPLTLPAHSSLFTGRYADEHGVHTNTGFVLPQEELTLAEVLNEEGYQTAAFLAAFVLDQRFGLAQGFEHYDDAIESVDIAEKVVAERSADEITDAALRWFDGRDESRPFFVWLHYYDPHFPHELPAGETARFPSTYHTEVAFVDAQLARVRAKLEQRSELARTLVVLTADHGEGQGEHGEETHGYFLYQGTQHIPLILSHPALPQGRESQRNASLVDLMPTALAFLDLEGPRTSGVDLLAESSQEASALFMEAELGRITFGLSPLFGVVDGPYKLINTPDPELYDLSSDPTESVNLAGAEEARVTRLQALLDEREGHARSSAADAAQQDADQDVDARLQSLGYTGGATDTEVTRTQWTSEQLARWNRLSNAGMSHYLADDFAKAVIPLRKLVEECPESYSGRLYLGLSLVRSGEVSAGMQHLEQAVKAQPDLSADVWWDVAMGRALAKDMAGAREALERTIALHPGHLRALQKLAELQLKGGERDAARAHLDSLLERAPQSAEGRWAKRELRKLGE